MEFGEFVRRVDAAVRDAAAVGGFDDASDTRARWETRARSATVELAPPRNVSVTLAAAAEPPATTWYPIDAALVPVVSKRIAAYLGEA
ncbi:MAG: hypothetical protein QOJ39_866 [Candidatus Eremiobacteraeota bacterium]|jgi:hypothetical protein|nr:hypothetical protein [Candidatus Eremiobacteraeota bacterium]MEA2719002.1 hypothetical protein [Candidatus Eremiobacteraeota bacterium]